MSATAPALTARAQRRIAVVRLADGAAAIAWLSVAYAVLLVLFPVAFPQIVVQAWQTGNLLLAMIAVPFVLDLFLYMRVSYMQRATPTIPAGICLGFLPVAVVLLLASVQQSAVAHTLLSESPNQHARAAEEILAQTYLTLVAGVFIPFLAIRLLQQFRITRVK